MHIQWILLTLWALHFRNANANKFNVSYTELQFCKEYDVKSGYKYSTFFHIESMKPKPNVEDKDDTVVIDLRLFVLASKDAHILLSPTDQIKSSPIYEIVLGAGGNTFNEIRRQRQSHSLKTQRVKNFLSPTDIMPLTVKITKSGNISVAITGQPPFISASDPSVLDIKYISFSTWGTAEGKWFYDCEPDDVKTANETKGNRLDTIEENLTNAERLEKDVLFGIDSTMAPPNLTKVFLNFDLANAKFNAQKAFLSSRGRFRAHWIDSRLIWNSTLYGGEWKIQQKRVGPYTGIWTPQIRLLNGKDDHFTYLPLFYSLTAFSNGSVWAESTICSFSTWCLNTNRNWPYEKVNCDIQIQLDHFASAILMPLNETSTMIPRDPEIFDFDDGEWHIIETNAVATLQSTLDTPYVVTLDRFLSAAYVLEIGVHLERNSLFYNQLISVPLIGAFLLILLSFWVERFLRILLNAISLIVLIGMLLVFATHGPNQYTPTIVHYYASSLFLVWVSLVTFTMHAWCVEQRPNIEFFKKITSSEWAQKALRMAFLDLYEYKDFEEDAAHDFCKLIDRLLFVIYLIIFCTCTAVGY